MCTNSALVDSLECYMDDLVDCFEDFVKKSLLVIAVAIGTVVVMLLYVLKLLNERPGDSANPLALGTENVYPQRTNRISRAGDVGVSRAQMPRKSDSSVRSRSLQNMNNHSKQQNAVRSNYLLQDPQEAAETVSAEANTSFSVNKPSFDEKVLRDIGFSCCSKEQQYSGETILTNKCIMGKNKVSKLAVKTDSESNGNKNLEIKDTVSKDTEDKDTDDKNTENNNTESKNTESKDTESKNTESKDTESKTSKETKSSSIVTNSMKSKDTVNTIIESKETINKIVENKEIISKIIENKDTVNKIVANSDPLNTDAENKIVEERKE